MLGGIAPDIDAALMAVGWDVYLRWHELGTHALAGTPLVALLTAAVRAHLGAGDVARRTGMRRLARCAESRRSSTSTRAPTIRLLWPLSSHVFSTPVVAMADPLAIGVMLLGAWRCGSGRAGRATACW